MARKPNENRFFSGEGVICITSQLYWIPKEQSFAVRKKPSEYTGNEVVSNDYFKKILIDSITHIKSSADYLLFYQKDETVSKVLGGITIIAKCLTETSLIRTYRSCIMNTSCMLLKKDAVFVVNDAKKQIRIPTGTKFFTQQKLIERFGPDKDGPAFAIEPSTSSIRVIDRRTHTVSMVLIEDIAFIRLIKDYIVIWCWSNKVFELRAPMKTISDQLAQYKFLVTDNQNHLANMSYASEIREQKLVLQKPGYSPHYMPVSKKRRKRFIKNWITLEQTKIIKMAHC